ncbi:hypothetical protein ACLOJK_039837 [Asimina triloba]
MASFNLLSLPFLLLLLLLLLLLSCSHHPSVTLLLPNQVLLSSQSQPKAQPFTFVCDPTRLADLGLNPASFSFCNKSLSYAARVKDLVDSMTLEEKALQTGHNATGVPRLGLPPYNWWSEILHGVSAAGPGTHFSNEVPGATSFPAPILTTASFNYSLWKTIAEVASTEARAMHNLGLAGLTFWSPTMNVARDPRWGRTMETPGEDPFIISNYSVTFVGGLQNVEGKETAPDLNTRPLKISACCKHFTAYDLENWHGLDRWSFDAKVTEQDIVETFNRPFEACIREGDVSSIMCSFNRVNGIPSCADTKLLSGTIRGEWNLHGYIVSDCDAVKAISTTHKWLNDTPEAAVSQALQAGVDLECGSSYQNFTVSAVHQGLARESDVDKALTNLYMVLMRLGYFDGSPDYVSLGKADICTQQNIELSVDSARQGMVLLENKDNALPLDLDKHKKLAVVGPLADDWQVMLSSYSGTPCRIIRPVDGLAKFTRVNFRKGCADASCNSSNYIFPAIQAAQESDATILVFGLNTDFENEMKDRDDLLLPGYQSQLIEQVAEASEGPAILVLFSGGPVDIDFAKNNDKVSAIIWAGYPGAEGGRAIADIIFGKYSPGGRLPITWYPNDYIHKLPMTSMKFRPDDESGYPGRSYKFYNGSTVYPFGYGLSYTRFSYRLVSAVTSVRTKLSSLQHCLEMQHKPDSYIPPCQAVRVSDLECKDSIDFEIKAKNEGKVDGPHVMLAYSIPPVEYVGAPAKQVVGFERVFIKAGDSARVKFSINACKALSLVTESAYVVLPWGKHTISVGDGEIAITFPIQVSYDLGPNSGSVFQVVWYIMAIAVVMVVDYCKYCLW